MFVRLLIADVSADTFVFNGPLQVGFGLMKLDESNAELRKFMPAMSSFWFTKAVL
jgi:hypothetical protein